jgi:TorA maturation chaperone TorD
MLTIEQKQAFGLCLDYLGQIFLEPPQSSFIDRIAAEDLYKDWPLPAVEETATYKGLQLLLDFSRRWRSAPIDDLTQEYTRLFIGLERTLAPPYESVYLSRDHIMFERQTLEVRDYYKKAGLEIPRLHKEPDDHIGYELLFASFLCGQESTSAQDTLIH